MKLTVERLPESRAMLEIAADEEQFAQAMDKAYRRVAQQVALPGFRKGKAPRGMIEKAYGRGIFIEEAHRLLMDDLYRQAIETSGLTPVGNPEVEIVEIEPLAFKVTVPVYPDVDPGDYASVRVEPVDAEVDDATIEESLENLRKASSAWIDPEPEGMELGPDNVLQPKARLPRAGDQVTIDYRVYDESPDQAEEEEDAQFVLGESGLLERLEQEIQAMRVGETREFEASFAEDDEVVDPGLRGKTMHYRVTLKGLKERDLIPLDDELAKTVSGDLDTLGQLRERLRESHHQERTATARTEVLGSIIERMADRASIEIPGAMVDETVEEEVGAMRQRLARNGLALEAYLRMTGQSLADLRTELRPAAEQRLRQSLFLREVAKRESVEVSDEEIAESVGRMVASSASAANPGQAEAFFRSDYVRDTLRNELYDRKLKDRLIEIATEGRGAVLNAWEPKEAEATDAEIDAVVAAAVAEDMADDSVYSSDDSSDDSDDAEGTTAAE